MYLLLDIGGTKTRVGVSEDLKDIDAHQIIQTPKDFEGGVDAIKQTAANLSKGRPFKACAVGIREILNPNKDSLVNDLKSSAFSDWINKPIKQVFEHELSSKVFLENDAAMAALGEATWGSGSGYKVVGFLTISTGVGGAVVVDGKIGQSSIGFEPGEHLINYLGGYTYFADGVSGIGIEENFGRQPEQIDDQTIWHKVTKTLAVGVYNTMVFWSPDVVVLGGSVTKSISLETLSTEVAGLNRKFPTLPPIKQAKLADLSGLYGSLEYLKLMV